MLILILLLALLCPSVSFAQVSAKEIQDKADSIAQPVIDSIVAIQKDWVKTHKGFWQGLKTPTVVPPDGKDTPPEKNVKPVAVTQANVDAPASWDDAKIALPTDLPCSVEVHVHDGPEGKGFTIYTHIAVGAQTFTKATGFGPHSNTSAGWTEVIPEKVDVKGGDVKSDDVQPVDVVGEVKP